MKRLSALLISVVIVMSLTACGGGSATKQGVSNNTSASKTEEVSENAEWRQFLKDYEAFVDSYIEFMKKYTENPSDLSLISDYSKMVADVAKWAERAEKIETDLGDTDESLEFAAEVLRIAGKVTDALTEIAN